MSRLAQIVLGRLLIAAAAAAQQKVQRESMSK
jgi:hypothetical protein